MTTPRENLSRYTAIKSRIGCPLSPWRMGTTDRVICAHEAAMRGGVWMDVPLFG